MKKLLLLTLLFTSLLCEAQQYLPYIVWQKNIGTNSYSDDVWDAMETNDGGYLLCAYTEAGISQDKTDIARGGGDIWLIKLNSDGIIEWQKTIGGNDLDRINKVKQTADNGYIIGGSSRSGISGEKTIAHFGSGPDYWFLKLDKSGNIQWQKAYAGSNQDNMSDFSPTKDGGFIIGGSSNSDSSFNKKQNSRGAYDYWVIKVDSIGVIQWEKTLGGANYDWLSKVSQTLDGGYIVAGSSQSNTSGDKTMDNEYQDDFWVIKLDINGNILWQKNIGSGFDTNDELNDIVLTKDSCFILGGASTKNHIVKINSQGDILWRKNINSDNVYNLSSISPTLDSGYIVGGWSFANIGGDKTENSRGLEDYWILKFDSNWNLLWDKTIGGSNADNLRKIIPLKDKDYLLIGNSASDISGEKTSNIYTNSGMSGDDLWIIKIRVTNGANLIKGSVFKQFNTDCIQNSNEKGIPNVIVKTEPHNFFNITNEQGSYSLLVDTGTYKVKQITPAILKPFLQQIVCPSIGYHTVSFSQYGQDTSGINFANYEKQCAYLQVELSQARMRRCFNNN
ncbi:MAG TPA: hypothetical protein PK431_07815, partial [Chitinophagales bacterium]|nr:hypothetical protein [Chitinophagales bacterium]